jgi:hypothetical protein
MNKLIKTIAVLLALTASAQAKASCINMETSLVCNVQDKDISKLNKIEGVHYKVTENNTNRQISSIELDLNNTKETLYLNLSSYTKLTELKITKNYTSKAYIKLSNVVIKISNNEIKEVKNVESK